MKTALVILGCLGATLSTAAQSISVQLVLDQDQYLAGETLPAKVRISNFTGQVLRMGKEADWLTFLVEDAQHLTVGKRDTLPVVGEFTLEPSMTATKRVDLSPGFDLIRTGRYYVTAMVSTPWMKQAISSKPVAFDVIGGSSIWEQEFGVPGTLQAGDAPAVRRYALVETLHSKKIKLYFRLSAEPRNRIMKVYPLGVMVSFSNPEPQLDRFSNLHVLYQTSARMFAHCLVNPDGILIARETYEVTNSRPALKAEPDGRVTVAGGIRRLMPSDLPPPPEPISAPHAKPNQP